LALAVRLFGNMMSETMLIAILLIIAPLFLPVVLELLGLLIGQVQAYIFAVLATVYIVSASSNEEKGVKSSNGGI
jgi:F-type H+-transporting ATPase subunit a